MLGRQQRPSLDAGLVVINRCQRVRLVAVQGRLEQAVVPLAVLYGQPGCMVDGQAVEIGVRPGIAGGVSERKLQTVELDHPGVQCLLGTGRHPIKPVNLLQNGVQRFGDKEAFGDAGQDDPGPLHA